jgi:hypothetical protein
MRRRYNVEPAVKDAVAEGYRLLWRAGQQDESMSAATSGTVLREESEETIPVFVALWRTLSQPGWLRGAEQTGYTAWKAHAAGAPQVHVSRQADGEVRFSHSSEDDGCEKAVRLAEESGLSGADHEICLLSVPQAGIEAVWRRHPGAAEDDFLVVYQAGMVMELQLYAPVRIDAFEAAVSRFTAHWRDSESAPGFAAAHPE